MAKKKSTKKQSKPPSKAAPRESKAKTLREKIERLDRKILAQLNERAKLAQREVRIHRNENELAYPAVEQQEVISKATDQNQGPLDNRCVRSVFRELLSGCRSLQSPLKVAYLGPPYSYSYLAAVEHFGQSVELVPVATIRAVFEEVHQNQADFGLAPIENSTDGRVADTLDMFTRISARICGEVQLCIHHHLLGKCSRAEIQEVRSKPQALSQCRDWLAKHLPTARTVETTSTAAAAESASKKQGTAAIASLQAAANYGLNVIAPTIEDNEHNLTRFAVIGSQDTASTGNDKTSLMFQVHHRPGALAEAMNIFRRHELNLTWIESFPMSDVRNEYLFFVEMEGHETDKHIAAAIKALQRKTVRVVILGSFAVTAPIE